MALYAIGDVQGCYGPLRRLLDKISFDPQSDQLWLTGDLVNRGPQSLEVLRYVASLGDGAISVLGNHDLHLLAVANGISSSRANDTLAEILAAPDREELLAWLSTRPLLHHDATAGYTLVHAGFLPEWGLSQAVQCAREVEAVLRGPNANEFFRNMYGDKPDRWDPNLTGWARWRLIVNAFTRLRFCAPDGSVDYSHKGAPGSQPSSLIPWFQHPHRRTRQERVVFGHWSMLGLYDQDGVIALDTGCVWGKQLTAVRLSEESKAFVSVHCDSRPDR